MRATSGTQESLLPDVTGVRHAWRRAGEVVLHVAEAGDGPPLVLLHGWPQHWYEWRDLIEPLSREYRVICPDLRGCGWSEAPPRGYDRETMARDVLALLDGMGNPPLPVGRARLGRLGGIRDRRARARRVELVEGVGHFIVDQRPDLVLERARAFFA